MTLQQTVIALTCFLVPLQGDAADVTVDFDWDIRPILSENCFFCHGPDEEDRKAKLRLDVDFSASADIVVPGDPACHEFRSGQSACRRRKPRSRSV